MSETIKNVEVSKIEAGAYQTRVNIDSERVDDLAASIARIGLLVPLLVVQGDGVFVVLSGHHRLEALKRLGKKSAQCIVRQSDECKNREVAIADNLFRTNITPVEQASAIHDLYTNKIMTIEQIAHSMHRSEEWVRRQMDLMAWPEDVLAHVHSGVISVSAAHNLALITDENYRAFLLRNAAESGATARATAAWLQAWRTMLPPEQAVKSEPEEAGDRASPALPQAPCIACNTLNRPDAMSYVLICSECINALRNAGLSG